jgi:hypothetical protein
LGGSYARDAARPDSDVDLGVYYREAAPFAVAAVRRLAAAVNDTPDPTVTDFGGWGRWVDGGAWLTVRGQRVDFIYRSVERLQHWIDESRRGEFEQDYYVHDAYGFRTTMYLGELRICRPLYDPEGVVAALKAQAEPYPPALKAELIRTWLPISGRSFYTLRKAAARGDVYMAVGCLTRIVALLTQVLCALNETSFVTDYDALERIEAFPGQPPGYAAAVRALLGHPGATVAELTASADRLAALHRAVAVLCQEWVPLSPGAEPTPSVLEGWRRSCGTISGQPDAAPWAGGVVRPGGPGAGGSAGRQSRRWRTLPPPTDRPTRAGRSRRRGCGAGCTIRPRTSPPSSASSSRTRGGRS